MAVSGGKIILCGEHAVVHGTDALVVGLGAGVTATALPSDGWSLTTNGHRLESNEPSLLALERVGKYLAAEPHALVVEASMPLGVGLGGSAAMAVAVARAIAEARGETLSNERTFAAAQVWERVFHGNPSGVDAAAATYGGCLLYNRAEFAQRAAAGTLEPTRVSSLETLHLAVAVAGPPSLTSTMVERVASHKQRDEGMFQANLAEIQNIVSEARTCIERGSLTRLGTLMCQNHAVLRRWDVSTPELDQACKLALNGGAWGAKLTGAGGGGCVVALCSSDRLSSVLETWRRASYPTSSAILVSSQ
jgi:mevalonate kinase